MPQLHGSRRFRLAIVIDFRPVLVRYMYTEAFPRLRERTSAAPADHLPTSAKVNDITVPVHINEVRVHASNFDTK